VLGDNSSLNGKAGAVGSFIDPQHGHSISHSNSLSRSVDLIGTLIFCPATVTVLGIVLVLLTSFQLINDRNVVA